jgi:aspartate aminotransferase
MENPRETLDAVRTMLAEYERRRDWLIPALNEIDGFECKMPEGAFYAFVDVRSMFGEQFRTSADVADAMLEKAHTAVTDGAGFGADGFLRFSYATSMENLHKAVDRLKELFNTGSPKAASVND